MNLDIFSDPFWSLGRRNGLSADRYSEAGQYDVELVKPALLLADQVILRTWRKDEQFAWRVRSRSLQFGIPFQARMEAMVGDDDLDWSSFGMRYGMRQSLIDALTRHPSTPKSYLRGEDFFSEPAVGEFHHAMSHHCLKSYDLLAAPQLQPLVQSGELLEVPWVAEPGPMAVPNALAYVRSEMAIAGEDSLVDALRLSGTNLMFDPGLSEVLPDVAKSMVKVRALKTLEGAASMMRMIDGLRSAPLDEVVDLRKELKPFLVPFRSYILSQAETIDLPEDAPQAERQRVAELKWEIEVIPAVDELQATIASNRYLKNLVATAAEGPEAAIGVGLGITTALASGALGIAALPGLGVAALPSLIKAGAATLRGKREIRRSRVLFVVEAEKRFARG